MKRVAILGSSLSVLSVFVLLGVVSHPAAQTPKAADPRVGLKPGVNDADKAAWHLELIASLPKPPGFFDPSAPAGEPTAPERDRSGRTPDPEPDPSKQEAAWKRVSRS